MARPRDTGAGSTFKRADSRFWWIAYRHDGHNVTESAKTEKRGEAQALLRQRLTERDAGAPPPPPKRAVTLGELQQMMLDDYVANGRRSLARARRSSTRALERLGADSQARDVGVAEITAYVAQRRAERAANATINRELAALRRMFRLGVRAGRLERRPDFTLLKENNIRKGFLERPQLESIMAQLEPTMRPAVLCGYITGWRTQSEILTRRWQHVDLAAGWLRLEPGETKNDHGRMFPLTPELKQLLSGLAEATKALEHEQSLIVPWVFHRPPGGRRLTYGVLLKAWRAACRAAGLPGKYLHDMRRSAVRNLERAGVPRSTAMAMVGHETESIYRRYAIVDEVMLREGAAKLAGLG